MKIFFSHSISAEDGPVASRLKAVAAAYGIRVVLPERSDADPRDVGAAGLGKAIRAADAVVALVTVRASQSEWVMRELRVAEAAGKPVVLLLEDESGFDVEQLAGPVHIVRFDRSNPAAHERELVDALRALVLEARGRGATKAKREAAVRREAAAVGAFVGIAIGLLVLGAFALAMSNEDGASA